MEKLKEKIKKIFSSIKTKLFFTISITIILVIIFLIIVNNFALGNFYLYSKQKTLKTVYETINQYYNNSITDEDMEDKVEEISEKNNFDILIKNNYGASVYTTNKRFSGNFNPMNEINDMLGMEKNDSFRRNEEREQEKEIEVNESYTIKKLTDRNNGMSYIMLSGTLDNGYSLFIRMPVTAIQDSVRISNNFLILMAGFTVILSAIIVSIISKKFTQPILELNNIAKKMSNLDFSQKYRVTDAKDEINTLGRSINTMSDKLETTIKQLKETNIELEKDIEEKSKIDEMRKSFISDVSHELKTPIALIQGYSEGLIENVNNDEESRKFYAEVILDETNKMDKLVKQLLELMKLEYGKREFNNQKFNIVELEKEVIRKTNVMIEEKNIEIEFDDTESIEVFADDFYIEQVIRNYITNAIKHVKKVENKAIIRITNEKQNNGKLRVKIFNSGEKIKEEDLNRIWNRFYKADESRNRDDGGTGIGLSIVKAIMNNYNSKYGVENLENGVEFYFEIDLV